MTHTTHTTKVDTRTMQAKRRNELVLWAFDQLDVGSTIELLSDHEPVALHGQFEQEKVKLFTWKYLESGPELWRAAVTKVKGKHGAGGCCGACGG